VLFGLVIGAVAEAGLTPPPDLPAGPSPFQYCEEDEFAALLTGAGLEDPRIRTVAVEHRLEDYGAAWDDFIGASVRVAAVIQRQDAETQERVKALAIEKADAYRTADGYAIPISVRLGSARKP
jgi:hypothetical protein